MAKSYVVIGACAVVALGDTEVYLYHGSVAPEGATNIDHLVEVGLVAEANEADPLSSDDAGAPEAASGNASGSETPSEAGDGAPDADDLDGIDRLDALREVAESEGVDVAGISSKDGVRDAIRAHRATHSNL